MNYNNAIILPNCYKFIPTIVKKMWKCRGLFKAGLALTLGYNLTCCFSSCISHIVCFKTPENKTPADPDKISKEIFPNL